MKNEFEAFQRVKDGEASIEDLRNTAIMILNQLENISNPSLPSPTEWLEQYINEVKDIYDNQGKILKADGDKLNEIVQHIIKFAKTGKLEIDETGDII